MKHVESAIQRELVTWLTNNYPDIEVIYRKNEGLKSAAEGKLDKLMGLQAGVPDLQLLLYKDDWVHILELELKKVKGSALRQSQKDWFANFKPAKNREAIVAKGLIDAQKKITNWRKKVLTNP
jgi:hypothetical protein